MRRPKHVEVRGEIFQVPCETKEVESSLVDLVAGQTISIFVDGYSNSGSYQLSITEI